MTILIYRSGWQDWERWLNNLWWSWNPAARMLFKTLDRQAWKESVHNPDKMLKEIPFCFHDSDKFTLA